MRLSAKNIVIIAIFIAISLLLKKVLTIPLPIGVFSFGGLPILAGGLLLGPWGGAWIGGVSDILGCILFPRGPYLPYFTLTAILTGVIPPIFISLLQARNSASFLLVLLSVAIAQIVTKAILFPIIMEFCFGVPFLYTFSKSILVETIHIPLYTIFIFALLKARPDSYVIPERNR